MNFSLPLGVEPYTKLIEQLSSQLDKKQEHIKALSTKETFSRRDLEEETEKIKSLYEAILFSESMVPYLKKVFEGFSIEDKPQALKEKIARLVEALKLLWDVEMKKDVGNKSTRLLQEIGEKETAIKEAIQKQQDVVEALALAVRKKAEQFQQHASK